MAEVAFHDNPDEERYEITLDGELAGFVQYRARPGIIAMIHTEVDPAFEGHGLGGKLVSGALDDARTKQLDVLPFCPFVNRYISEHDEYLPLVPEDMREKFGLGA